MGMGYSSYFGKKIAAPSKGVFSIKTGSIPDVLIVKNLTRLQTPTGSSRVSELIWYKDSNTANLCTSVSTTTAATTYGKLANGLVLSAATQYFGVSQSFTAGTNASPPVISATAHGLVTGDSIVITNSSGRRGLVGIEYSVTRVNADSFNLTYSPAPGAVLGSGSFIKRTLSSRSQRQNYILGVTKAQQAVVTLSVIIANTGIKVGSILTFSNLDNYGMTQLDGMQGKVLSISGNTITVDIDTRNFTTFSFRTPAAGKVGSPAIVIHRASVNPRTAVPQERITDVKFTVSSSLYGANDEIFVEGVNFVYGVTT